MQSVEVVGLTLPYHYYTPTQPFEFGARDPVVGYVSAELSLPKINTSLGSRGTASVLVSIPKAAVDEYGTPEPREHHVWSSGQLAALQNVTETCPVQASAHHDLGRSMFSFNTCHQTTSSQALFVCLRHLTIATRLVIASSLGSTNSLMAFSESMVGFP